ncbi:MAG: DUF4860 domain-containing protein [Lachnospiraceae bacterium]|nr:DUF4860 domain-containing protein [Lachnospiraceae bacterium]
MRFRTKSSHVIDLVFPIALFFVFAASCLSVLILAANIYASTTHRLAANDENRMVLSYISEKIRQNDTEGAIRLSTIDGTDCLTMSAVYNGTPCTTYIYEYEGMLKELFINDGVPVSLKSGKNIMEISSLSMEQLEDHVYQFTSVDSEGTESSLIASERSVP